MSRHGCESEEKPRMRGRRYCCAPKPGKSAFIIIVVLDLADEMKQRFLGAVTGDIPIGSRSPERCIYGTESRTWALAIFVQPVRPSRFHHGVGNCAFARREGARSSVLLHVRVRL